MTGRACRPSTDRRAHGAVFLFAFDLLEINGQDLRREPIEIRKRELAKLLEEPCRAGGETRGGRRWGKERWR